MRAIADKNGILIATVLTKVGPPSRDDGSDTAPSQCRQYNVSHLHRIIHDDTAEANVDWPRACAKEFGNVVGRGVLWFLPKEKAADILGKLVKRDLFLTEPSRSDLFDNLPI